MKRFLFVMALLLAYAQEAAQQYDGPVLVPDDLEVIPLD